MPYKDPNKRKYVRPRIAVIDKTSQYDTATREQVMQWREEEYQKYLKQKAERKAKGLSEKLGTSTRNGRSVIG